MTIIAESILESMAWDTHPFVPASLSMCTDVMI